MSEVKREKIGLWIAWDESIDETRTGFSREDLVKMAALALRENDIRILPREEWPTGIIFTAEEPASS